MSVWELSGSRQVTVHVRFGDVEQTFTGSVEDVWSSLNRFFGEFCLLLRLRRGLC